MIDIRSAAAEAAIETRSFSITPASLDREARTVEAVIATETPVAMRGWDEVDEVLLMGSLSVPSQLPLLEVHSRWSLSDVLGSIRSLRVDGASLIGKLHFATGDERSESAWNKVEQGHLRDVSVGYVRLSQVEIQPGQAAVVAGRTFQAGKRTLRVVTDWKPVEASLVPIGADQQAKIRSVNPRAGVGPLNQEKELTVDENERNDQTPQNASGERAAGATPAPTAAAAVQPAPVQPAAETRSNDSAAVTAERARIVEISQMGRRNNVPQAEIDQAISGGLTADQAGRRFLDAVSTRRDNATAQPESVTVTGPAIRSHDPREDINVRTLAAGMLISQGLDPTRCRGWNGRLDAQPTAFTVQEAEIGNQFRRMAAADLVRSCTEIDTGRRIHDLAQAFELMREGERAAGVSVGSTLSYVFTTNVYARLVAGWDEAVDTTAGWVDEEDVPNFLSQEDISITASAGLQKLARAETAKDASASDTHETYKIARYAKKFTVDEQDVINDRLGAIMAMPREMGMAARRLKPDMVYGLINRNPALVADSVAVFDSSTHANLGSTVLGTAGLQAAISAMRKVRSGTVLLNIRPRFLLVPAALEWTARELLTKGAQAKTGISGTITTYVPVNVVADENLTLVIDDRLGATGVYDPVTEATVAGSDTAYYLSTGGQRTIRVAYLRGTNRMPVMRSYVLDKGQWGMGWDINYDIGAAFMDYRGMYKGNT